MSSGGRTGALLALAVLLAAALPASAQAAGCRATAEELERGLPVEPFVPPDGEWVGQALCFDFTGDGRRDIVFTGWEAMNRGGHYWAAFRRMRSGEYERVKFKRSCCRRNPRFGQGIGIQRQERTILVTEPIYRRGDAGCCPTGGEREGRWRWRSDTGLMLVGVSRDPEGPNAR